MKLFCLFAFLLTAVAHSIELKVTQVDRRFPVFTFALKEALLTNGFTLKTKNRRGVEKVIHSSLIRRSDGQFSEGRLPF